MSPQGLQTDKLVPVELPEICAPRLELLGRFDQASGKRYIYISAPAGCGKTVSTCLWIKKTGWTPIWLGLDIYDNTPAAFYRFFCTALFSVIPQDESLTKIVKDPAFNVSPVEYTIEVLSRLSFDERKFALVLDDFHFITDEEILKSLLYVVKRLPLSVTVLILSRNKLPRAFYTLEENGRAAFVKASELAFNSNEIRRHFASYGRFITAEEAEEIFSLTEGWAIAVSALVLSGNITTNEKLQGNPLGKYIKTQIWDKLDDDLRYFMMQTSIVDEFTVELCEQITENLQSPQVLKMLCGGNLFISRQNGGYRYHHLFLDFLRTEASKYTAIKQKSLYQKAAEYYYLDQGDYFNALRYFLKSGDSKGIAAAFYNYLEYNGQSSSEISKIYFINELPADVLEENPFLYISCAFCSFLFGDVKSMYFYFDRIYERVHDIEKKNKAFMEGVLILFAIDPRYSFMEQISRFQTSIALEAENRNIPKALRSLGHNLPYFHKTFRDFSHYALNMEENFAEFRFMFFALLGNDYKLIESGVKSGLLYKKTF